MDDNIQTLKADLVTLIRAGNEAKNVLFATSRRAEDAVRAFQTEQKERIDELAEKSVSELREITEDRCEAIDTQLSTLTGHLKLISDRSYTDNDLGLATQCVKSSMKDACLHENTVHFEGNLDLADSLSSVSRLGRCHSQSGESILVNGCCASDVTEKKSFCTPFWYGTGCRVAGEHSWATSTITSVSDNNYYDTISVADSHLTLNSRKGSLKHPEKEKKILNVKKEKNLVSYIGKFEAYKHRTPCVIPDIAILDDMKIIVIDHYHNSIQLFSEDFSQLDEQFCPYPIGMCRLNESGVVVSLRRKGQLAVFQVNKTKLEHQRNIRVKCESYLWQVAYKSSHLYVVCDENNIHVLDLQGSEKRVVRSGVPPEHGYLRYFDVNEKERHIYLSERQGLRCINFKGKLQWMFTNDDFPEQERDKHGHTIEDVFYGNGMILGTHWTLSKIFQISTDGKFLRNIIIDHLEHPRVISMFGNRLAVTQFHPAMKHVERRTIKVFEMQTFVH